MFGHRQIKHYSAYKKNQHVHLGFKGDVHFNFTYQKSGYILPPFLVTKKVGSINRLPIFPLFTDFSKIDLNESWFELTNFATKTYPHRVFFLNYNYMATIGLQREIFGPHENVTNIFQFFSLFWPIK